MANVYGYIRVSTKEQKTDRQKQALKEYAKKQNIKFNNIFEDKQSGKDFERESYQTMKKVLNAGDTLVIKELDRLGRNMDGIKAEWNDLRAKGVEVVIIDNEMLSTKGKSDLEQQLISNIVFELLSYMAEKERIKIKQRQAEGIEQAKVKGTQFGRPKRKLPENFQKYYMKWKAKEITQVEFAKLLEVTTMTIYRYIKQYEGEN